MKKYNPNVAINPNEKCENIAILKDLLSEMNVYTLANLTPEELLHLKTLLSCDVSDADFLEYFPNTAIISYNNVYGHPIHRDRTLMRKTQKSRPEPEAIDWSDAAVLQRQRKYIREHLIPTCRHKVHDMLSGKAYQQIRGTVPLDNLPLLQQLLDDTK